MKRFSERKPDYYSTLQIGGEASYEEIRAAYKRLALLTHPDRSGHPQANRQMQNLNEAYEVLSDPEKRAQYDADRKASRELATVERPAPPSGKTQPVRADQGDLERKWHRLLQKQLKRITYLILVVISLFFWSLASGRVNLLLILVVVLLAILTLASLVVRVRNPDS